MRFIPVVAVLAGMLSLSFGCLAREDWGVRDVVARAVPTTWGDFAALLDVPECPSSNPVLMVDTTADELDGGQGISDPAQAGDFLSLAEALWIADNRGSQQTILFDSAVFPTESPGRILLTRAQPLPSSVPVCLDGRSRGVIIEHAPGATESVCPHGCFPTPEASSLIVGVTMLNIPYFLSIGVSGQVAGCRLQGNDGIAMLANNASRFGPGNVLWGAVGFWVSNPVPEGVIDGNYFGYDPVTRMPLDLGTAVVAWDPVALSNNVFGRTAIAASIVVVDATASSVIANNYFGVDDQGRALGPGSLGLTLYGDFGDGGIRIGPGNVIRGVDAAAISVLGDGPHITRNIITGNSEGIVGSPASMTPPTITAVTTSGVEGTCPVAGTVEVFSDPGDQGEVFLGDVTCDGVSPWSLDVAVPRGRNATATLTDTLLRTSAFSTPSVAP